MELLRKKRGATGAEVELAELVSACTPLIVSDAHKRQTLNAVLERTRRRSGGWRIAVRLAFAAGVLLVAGVATAGAFGVRLLRWTPHPAIAADVPPRPVATHVARRVAVAPVMSADLSEPPVAPAPPEPVTSSTRPLWHAHPPRSEDPSQVVAAIQALRQDQDPARAGRLLAAYLRTHPRGALAEEAIALSIEAADTRHSPAAETFAERYVREYPHGRFRPTADRVLARAGR